jgi:hypothetical protein
LELRAQNALLAGLFVWGLAPIVLMIVHVVAAGGSLTGADGIVAGDQLQYLAWARDAGTHVLSSNLFELVPSAHVYAQPLFTASGLLWRAGIPLVAAYWLWKPVAVVVLFAGAARWSGRFFGRERGSRLAALTLILFLYAPLASLAQWTALGSQADRGNLGVVAGELFGAGDLWGYVPTAIAIGLMPLVFLESERALDPGGSRRRSAVAGAAAAALVVSWLHPWQGVTLLVMLVALAVWAALAREGQRRDLIALAAPAFATALPLVYYWLLSRFDSAWKLASHNELVPRAPVGVLLIGLGPLFALACAGARRPGRAPGERALLLWIPASLATYVTVGSFPSHALEGLSLPLGVMMVRGWNRLLASRRRFRLAAGALALGAVTLPGMAYDARSFRDAADRWSQGYYLSPPDAEALRWVESRAPRGGVLARTLFSLAVPSRTGRQVWVGHEFWSQDWASRTRIAAELFGGSLGAQTLRLVVLLSRARLVVSDCAVRTDLGPPLEPILASIRRFGCATVYVVRRT